MAAHAEAEATGTKRTLAVTAYVENAEGAILLVRTHVRADTWEMPGGRVEAGESLTQAVVREVLEETGMEIEPTAVSGVYDNLTMAVVVVVFRARLMGGNLRPQAGEIHEAAFVLPDQARLDRLVTRPYARTRLADARREASSAAVFEAREESGVTVRVDRLDAGSNA